MKNTKKLLAALLAGLQFAVPTLSWAQNAPTTTFAYDAVGQVTSVTSPSGRVNQLQWDAFGRNVQQSRAGAAVGYGYNYQDALTAVQDPRGLVTTYDRNGFGEARSQSSPDTGNTTFTWDAAGNVTSRVNAAGQVENYTFDAGNRVTAKTLAHPASGSIVYGFTYGTSGIEAGELVQVSAPGLALSYTHNIYGQVTSATQALAGTASLTTGYGYANNGAPTSVTYPSGRVVSYTLDGASRISGITVNGTAVLSGISYSPFGAVTGWSFTGGQAVSRTFDANARTTSVTMPWGPRQYSYDVDDRIVGINDTLLGSASYAYDNQDRLTSASNAAGSWTYQYDANGNRTAATISGSGYGTSVDNGSNRMLAAGQRQSTFTAAGQPSQVTSAAVPAACGTSLTLGYQADGQLVTSNVLSAIHAPNGLRLQKTAAACAGGAKTNFVYDNAGHLIGEYDAVGAVIRETVWLGDLPVAVFQAAGSSAAAYYVYADNLGTPRGITTAGGMLVWSWDGEPFGATPAISGQLGQQGAFAYGLRFPGQYFDEETGYHHNGWREYDPALGRYVQSDPIGLSGGLNTYEYANSSPLTIADPTGKCGLFTPACLMAGGFVVGTLADAAYQYYSVGAVDWMAAATTGAELASVFMFTPVRGGGGTGTAGAATELRALTAAEARATVGGANCPRTGPVNVDPGRHNANATVRDAAGNIIDHRRFVSGNMTAEEAALPGGWRAQTNATHTEARATTQMSIPQGGSMTITGQLPPCTSCRGYMNRAAYSSDASITYKWREGGATKSWEAKK